MMQLQGPYTVRGTCQLNLYDSEYQQLGITIFEKIYILKAGMYYFRKNIFENTLLFSNFSNI